jgi:hypothetical protein
MDPISPVTPSSPLYSSGGNDVDVKLWYFIAQYRELMQEWKEDPSPENTKKIEDLIHKIMNFVEKHKKEIEALGQQMGWPADGVNGYDTFIDGALKSMENFLEKPNIGSLDMINEQLTQLHWLITNHHKLRS